MKDNGAGVDPAGDLPIATTQEDLIGSHVHDAGTNDNSLKARFTTFFVFFEGPTPKTDIELQTFAQTTPWNAVSAMNFGTSTFGPLTADGLDDASTVAGVTADATALGGPEDSHFLSTIVNFFIKIDV